MARNIILSYLFLFLVVITLLLLATHPAYYPHLQTDVFVFYQRTSFFISNFYLTNLTGNEYPPGAMLFFILTSPLLLINNSFETYKLVLFIANFILIFFLSVIYIKFTKAENIIIFAIILLFTGPIIFFRFDLLVVALVALSFYLWKEKKTALSLFLLSFATLIKVYPIIFIPYLLILSYKNNGLNQIVKNFLIYLLGIIFLVSLYLFIFQADIKNLYYSLNYHTLKPIGLESVWATIIMLITYFKNGTNFQIITSEGIWGISSNLQIAPLWLYNYIWIVPLALLHLWFIKKINNKLLNFDIKFCLINILLFLLFSKVIAPQYILWFSLLLPLVDIKNLIFKTEWIINLFLILLIVFLYQYIYPLNYSEWLNMFKLNMGIAPLFLINALRNFLLVLLAVRLFNQLKSAYA